MILAASQEAGAGTRPSLLILGLLFLIMCVLVAMVLVRRRRVPMQSVSAGAEVMSTRTGRDGAGRPEPRPERDRPRSARRPERERGWERWAALTTSIRSRKVRKEQPDRPAAGMPADPQLTAPVLLEAAWHQAVYHGGRSAGRFRVAVRAATARGRSHAYEGTAGQDVAGVAWNEQRRSVFAVVADGLGSKVDSGQVARDIVDLTLFRAESLGQAGDPMAMIRDVIHLVGRTTKQRALDGAATVVVAEIRPDAAGVVVSTWGIGDSEAWLMQDGDWQVLHHERRSDGENVTRHLPGHTEIYARRTRVRQPAVVTLASDGFASALGSKSRVARELVGLWRTPPTPTDFLRQVNFEDPYFNDDRAAVAVWIR
jgi:hypothetical protein